MYETIRGGRKRVNVFMLETLEQLAAEDADVALA
jgi:hypothetical protein